MDSLPETVTCGPAREVIRNFLGKQSEERRNLSKEDRTRVALAFHHVEMCWHGNGMPNFCNDLWKELKTMTWEEDVARYLFFAKYPLHDAGGTDDNPLKDLEW